MKIALLVITCDKYSDLWPIFIGQFNKNWEECPFDKYFITNQKETSSSHFKAIKVGINETWSSGLYKALELLKQNYEYVFVTLEDSILLEKVNNDVFLKISNIFINENGNYLKFITKPKFDIYHNNYYGIISPNSLYRPTCVYSLWKICVLQDLLKIDENAWEFERFGSVRSDSYDKFYVVYDNFFKISNTIIKGLWVRKEKKKMLKLGYEISRERKTMNLFKTLLLYFKTFNFKAFNILIPWKYRRAIVFFIKHHDS